MSLKAYQKAQRSTENPRETEYRLFADVTHALNQVKGKKPAIGELVDAIDWNRRLWSTLAQDCAMPGNQLADKTRASVISIALWVTRYSGEVVRQGADIEPLITVNRSIMEGLGAQAAANVPPEVASDLAAASDQKI